MGDLSPAEKGKRAAALRALDYVADGMVIGLGTGSTAKWFVDLLAESGKSVTGVPTSSVTRAQAEGLGIPLTTLEEVGALALTVDGADEFDAELSLIKGGGGALLQEKIVATASTEMVVFTDPSKEVAKLGAFALPVEIVRYGWAASLRLVEEVLGDHGLAGRPMSWRGGDDRFVTDEGHFILDLALDRIPDAPALNRDLNLIPGVVETGLFCGIATCVIVGEPDGSTRVIKAPT